MNVLFFLSIILSKDLQQDFDTYDIRISRLNIRYYQTSSLVIKSMLCVSVFTSIKWSARKSRPMFLLVSMLICQSSLYIYFGAVEVASFTCRKIRKRIFWLFCILELCKFYCFHISVTFIFFSEKSAVYFSMNATAITAVLTISFDPLITIFFMDEGEAN